MFCDTVIRMGFLKALVIAEIAICCYGALIEKRQACEYSAGHTMCQTDKGTPVTIDKATQQQIVDLHNQFRSEVNPTASRMNKVVWDDELAKIAAKWAAQCTFGHDKGYQRVANNLPGIPIGQNGAYDVSSWKDAVTAWHDEIKSFSYGKGSKDGKTIGHFTQVTNDDVVKIGCGDAKCPEGSSDAFKSRAMICNYGRGQLTSEFPKPWTEGTPCDGCKGHCDEALKLCDCGGKICVNGGTMQYDTCTCKCVGIYKGDTCAVAECSLPDQDHCGSYKDEFCSKYVNVPLECPHKCKKC